MIKKKLDKIFNKNFNIDPKDLEKKSMNNTEKWDSFSHINLILEIEEVFKLKKIKPQKIAELTSYKKCLDYVKKKLKELTSN